MIGNDIIDLALAKKESNWKRKGFLEKLFTVNEQFMISNSDNPEIMIWNLWSRKEAAYKIYNRQTQVRAYIPIQLECFDIEIKGGIIYGKVSCYDSTYYTKTTITADYIETNAVVNPVDFEKIKTIDYTDSLVKTNDIPNYFDTEKKIWKPVSKTHHGRFGRVVVLSK